MINLAAMINLSAMINLAAIPVWKNPEAMLTKCLLLSDNVFQMKQQSRRPAVLQH
jgi:hypothetical protein